MTPPARPIAPLLVFGWGNPSRGDDALGPLFIEAVVKPSTALPAAASPGRIEALTDFQLQVEHALDLAGRAQVLFVDASLTCTAPFEVSTLQAARGTSVTSHALSPQAVMQVFVDLYGRQPPPCTLLAIRGERFELGEPPSAAACLHLQLALSWFDQWRNDTVIEATICEKMNL